MGKIVISDFSGGIDGLYASTSTQRKAMQSLRGSFVDGSTNPLIYPGYWVPNTIKNSSCTGTTPSSASELKKMIVVSDNNVDTTTNPSYYFIQGAAVHAIKRSTDKVLTGSDDTGEFPYTIGASGTHAAHSSFSADDIIDYQINGVRKTLIFWRDNTDGEMTMYDNASAFTYAQWDAAAGGAPGDFSPLYPIIAEVADNGYLYVANYNKIHKFDGTTDGGANGTVTTSVMTIPASEMFVDMADGLGKLWVATKPAQPNTSNTTTNFDKKIKILVWNRVSTQVSVEDSIPIDGAVDIVAVFFHDVLLLEPEPCG